MGVPAFYRWLVNKYPKVVTHVIQDNTFNASAPNPNGEFDNLYLDMNGIIHPCFHPEDPTDFQPSTFDQVFHSIFDYVDRLFNIVRPKKLIFFAIDGVAPRAKMNQQRARRFQNAKNSKLAEEEEDRLRYKYERQGKKLLPKVKSELDDSNIITPGTEFMHELSKALQGYVQTRLRENPAWKNLKVILSDSNFPGEGEHKIMSFIRSQRSLPGYDVNTRHCLHGLDADLIMLALTTHELHFSILREDVFAGKDEQPSRIATSFKDGDGSSGKPSESCKAFPAKKTCPYQLLHIWILREYLEFDMQPYDAPDGFKFDIERAVDDFVFMCFFVGNDFLPRLPSLEINEGALDLLMTVYKRDFKGYIVDAERINERKAPYLKLKRVERLVQEVGSYEEQIFKKRTEIREKKMRRILNEQREEDNDDIEDVEISIVNVTSSSIHLDRCDAENDNIIENTKQMKEEVTKYMRDNADLFKGGLFPIDKIKYGTHGWKERYYREKFGTDDQCKLESIKKTVVKEYTEGLCWVLLYYFSGVPSWTWFYPLHHAPCASDLKGLGQERVKFEEGFPFEPFDQLMAVLPPRSAEALPLAYRNLMVDLASFYPQDFEIDMDGKRFLWQGHCLLPFIDGKQLLSLTSKAKEELKEHEAERNVISSTDLLFVTSDSDFGSQLVSVEEKCEHSNANDFGGFVLNLNDIDSSEDGILCVNLSLPTLRLHVPRLLSNVKLPETTTVYERDIAQTVLWHEQHGGYGGNRVPRQTRYIGPPDNESSWRGRGRGFSGAGSSKSREGLYNHPNYRARSYTQPFVEHRGLYRPQRAMPGPSGFRPRSQNLSYSSQLNSESQMVGQFGNLSVSTTEVRGVSRGRGYEQASTRGERGWYTKSAKDWETRLL